MFLAFITLVVALSISAVAIYYSVAGLVAIFASAAIPIMIMGGALEIGKLVTAVWLHKYWKQATWWLKSYLSIAVLVLMMITSMGIFGFLSKAHIEQTSAGEESVAQVERLATEISRQQAIIVRAEEQIKKLETSGTGNDANVQSQIDKEQERIDTAYARIQPAIDEQNRIIGSQAKLYQDELDRIDTAMRTVAGYIDSGDKENYKKAQAIIGVRPDGAFGSASTRAYTAWKDAKNAERQVLLTNIQQATNNPQARAAAEEIRRLRTSVETQIAESNKLINRLRTQIGKVDNTANIDAQVDEQALRIKNANAEIDTLTEEKYVLEGEYRKLEAEVGPIKYIAEFVYGTNADKNMLEEAVKWVIIVIIFVFDPLAVLLLIASQYTFEWARKEREGKINDDESSRTDDEPSEQGDTGAGTIETESGNKSNDTGEVETDDSVHRTDDVVTTDVDTMAIEQARAQRIVDNVPPDFTTVESNNITIEEHAKEYSETPVVEKKDIKSSEELKREAEYDLKEQDETFIQGKTDWKTANPDQTLKHYKNLYVKGVIDSLPWETNTDSDNYNADEGYKQNAEQNEKTLFNRLRSK